MAKESFEDGSSMKTSISDEGMLIPFSKRTTDLLNPFKYISCQKIGVIMFLPNELSTND